ncbi:unnamed protein product [Mycena citricolor]|uniref:Uncharacterized protein n=1 Tax=Mycena citricolor TaxID=2018698 RepID=A0AAD2HCC7_9AGAR|nr:unnamed protein product [Mycena citricolor]
MLPPELVDDVVDNLADQVGKDDTRALLRLALIARAWVPRSRFHSFASITLVRNRSRDTVRPFLHLLHAPAPGPTFAACVRAVHLRHRSAYGSPVLSAGDILVALARAGIRPRHLRLECGFAQRGSPAALAACGAFAQLTDLDILLTGKVVMDRVLAYLAPMGCLRRLSLEPMELVDNDDTGGRALPPTLRELSIRDSALFSYWLDTNAPEPLPQLPPSLIFSGPFSHHYTILERHVSLIHLPPRSKLTYYGWYPTVNILSIPSAVEHVCFQDNLDFAILYASNILTRTRVPDGLRVVQFRPDVGQVLDSCRDIWTAFDLQMVALQASRKQQHPVTIVVGDDSEPISDALWDTVRSLMPLCTKQGTLTRAGS